MAARNNSSKSNASSRNLTQEFDDHTRELTALHAHADALAYATEAKALFHDGALAAALFDISERLVHLRDGLEEWREASERTTPAAAKKNGANQPAAEVQS